MKKEKSNVADRLKFLIIAIFIMIVADKFYWSGTPSYIEEARKDATVTEDVAEDAIPEALPEATLVKFEPEIRAREKMPLWKKNAVPFENVLNKPRIVIVIDDLGVNRKLSKEVLQLPAPLTLSFLPYARRVDEMVEQGHKNGHEIMLHMPMEPMNPDIDTGNIVLRVDQTPEAFDNMLHLGLSAFEGYVGLNNHMGSRLTQDKEAMARLMRVLHARGLLFLDSRTIAASVAEDMAALYQVPHAVRNVFLDHDPSPESIRESLAHVEKLAREHGYAIAIGHPKVNTIEALKEWLPTLEQKGFVLAPVSNVVITTFDAVSASRPQTQTQAQAQPHQ